MLLPHPARLRRALGRTLAIAALAAACASPDPSTAPAPTGAAAAQDAAVAVIAQAARPLTGADADYDPLVAAAAGARVVLLGESTHGTHEYYRERARITQRLIREHGFGAVAIEGDWAEAFRVNEYVRGTGGARTAEEALAAFDRFPRWMWANAEFRDLVRWIRMHNDAQPASADVGVYGLDIQSFESADEVARLLAVLDPGAPARVEAGLACLRPFADEPGTYGAAVARTPRSTCQGAAADVLREVQRLAESGAGGPALAETRFGALRAAHALVAAEEYFRAAATGAVSTWNLRDRRMAAGLEAVEAHVGAATGRPGRVVVWAHNTHVGDARQSESGEQGELNIGQLARERLGAAAFSVGFQTYEGSVFAAPDWGQAGRSVPLRPALSGSFPALLHAATSGGVRDFVLLLRGAEGPAAALAEPRLDRAVGVVYLPQTERQSHYLTVRLGRQYDAVVHVDRTTAVRPLAP